MRREIRAYTDSKKKLLKLFGCDADLPIRVLVDAAWHVEEHDDVSFLHYELQADGEKFVSVIANKNGEPWITHMNELTMIVAIDCIKFAFILKNRLKEDIRSIAGGQ